MCFLSYRKVVWELDFTKLRRMKSSNRYTLLDRGYGKPAMKEEQEVVGLPPVVIQLAGPS